MRVLVTEILIAFALVGFVGPPPAAADCATSHVVIASGVAPDFVGIIAAGDSRAGPAATAPIAINTTYLRTNFRPTGGDGWAMTPSYDRYKMETGTMAPKLATAPPLRE